MGVDNCHGRLVLVLVNGIQGIQGKKCSKDISNKTMLTITIMLKNLAEHSCYSFKCYAILTVFHKVKVSALKNFLIIIKSVPRHNKQESKLA